MTNMCRKRTQKKLIQVASARQVSFSKRRSGLFKKASELCTLCGVETTLILFSPGGKANSFGHPSVDAVINRFGHLGMSGAATLQEVEAHQKRVLLDLNRQYSDLLDQLKAEKERGVKLKQIRKESQGCSWFDTPIKELNFEELAIRVAAMGQLRGKLRKQMEERLAKTSGPSAAASSSGDTDPPVIEPAGINPCVGPSGCM